MAPNGTRRQAYDWEVEETATIATTTTFAARRAFWKSFLKFAPAAVCPGPKPLPPVRGFAGKENEGHLYVSSMAIPQEYSFVLFGFLFFNVLIHVSDCWISMYTIPHKLNFQTCSFCLSKALFGSRRAYERCVRDQKCKRGGEKKQKGNGNGKGRGKRSKGAGKDQ